MTARVLIVGDSHAAALRLAATRFAQDWPGLTFDFAAMHGDMGNFTVKDGALTARRKADRVRLAHISGQDSFPLAGYAAVAVCGGAPSNFHALRLYQRARFAALPSVPRDGRRPSPDWMLVSHSCFHAALVGMMHRASAFGLLALLAQEGIRRRILIPMPLLSARALDAGARFDSFAGLLASGDAPAMTQALDAAFLEACQDRAIPLPWPLSTRQHGFFTHPDFRRGATRLSAADDRPQPDDDYLHANADYGRAVLAALAALP